MYEAFHKQNKKKGKPIWKHKHSKAKVILKYLVRSQFEKILYFKTKVLNHGSVERMVTVLHFHLLLHLDLCVSVCVHICVF